MHRANRNVRTSGLLLIAVVLIAIGLASFMTSEWEFSLGPTTPVTTLPPKPTDLSELAPLQAFGLIQGLSVSEIGLPSLVAVGSDRLYVVDAYASSGVVKAYDFNGNHLLSFGEVSRDELNFVVDIAIDNSGQVVLLDASSSLFVYTPVGTLANVIQLNQSSRPELAWARAVQPTEDGYYVLALDNVYRFDSSGHLRESYPPAKAELTLATAPSEYYLGPSALSMQGDHLWVSDSVNGRLLRLGPDGRFDKSIMLPLKDGLNPYPTSFIGDGQGNFLVVDAARQTLLKLSPSGDVLSEVAIGSTQMDSPDDIYSLAFAPNGMLFLSDAQRGVISTWGTTPRLAREKDFVVANARFLFPSIVAVGDNVVYIVSGEPRLGQEMGYKVYKSDLTGLTVTELISAWDNKPLLGPTALKLYNSELYLLDGSRVLVFSSEGKPLYSIGDDIAEWGGFGVADLFGYPSGPQGLAFDDQGNLWVADTNRQRLVVFDRAGTFLRQVALGSEIWPQSLAFAPDGTLLVLNGYEGQFVRLDSTGKTLATYASPGQGTGQLGVVADINRLDGPRDLVLGAGGSIYVVDTYNSRIARFTANGLFEGAAGMFGSNMGEVYLPSGLAYHSETDVFFLADTYNHRVQMLKLR